MRSSMHSVSIAIAAVVITSATCLPVVAATPAPTTPAGSAPSPACALLTKEDAAAALGVAVTGPKAVSSRPMGPGSTVSNCSYSGPGYEKVNVNLYNMGPDLLQMYRGKCAQKDHQGLEGLGDLACWYNAEHGELQVIKGKNMISIQLQKSGDPTAAIKDVMKKAVGRLGTGGA